MTRILVTGGAGYVGSLLVPTLLHKEYEVVVYDSYFFGYKIPSHKNLIQIEGDIRDKASLLKSGKGCDTLIHLACLSNDPSCDLNPKVTKEINYNAFSNVLDCYVKNDIRRLIHASSATLYGFQEMSNLKENAQLNPITDYGKYKAECENLLKNSENIEYVIVRPGTISGYTPRMRFDLVVNMFIAQAIEWNKIKIFGGKQSRPIINIHDIIRVYIMLIEAKKNKIDGEIFNAISINKTVEEIAKYISDLIENCSLEYIHAVDERNYNLSNQKIVEKLNFRFKYGIEDAAKEIKSAYENNLIRNVFKNSKYNNVEHLKHTNLQWLKKN